MHCVKVSLSLSISALSPSLSIIYLLAKRKKKMGKKFHTHLSLIFRVQHTSEKEPGETCNEDNFKVKCKVKQKNHGFCAEISKIEFCFFSSDLLPYR